MSFLFYNNGSLHEEQKLKPINYYGNSRKKLNRAQLLKKYWKQGSKYHLGAKDFISNYENQYVVIKYGGFSLSKKKLVTSFAKNISLLNQLGVKVIIVHGGGPQIEKELKKER